MGLSPGGNRLIYTTVLVPSVSGTTVVLDLTRNTNLFSANTGLQSVGPAQWSGDGRFVAFTSTKSLTPADSNGTNDVFLLDVTNGTMRLLSMNLGGTGSGNGGSDQPTISGDGRFVVYRTLATDIVPGIVSVPNIVMYDRLTGSNVLLSAGQPASSWSSWMAKAATSTNGSTIAFQSWAPGLAAQDLNDVADAFAFEQQPSVIEQTNPPPAFEVEMAPPTTNGNQLVATMTWPALAGPSYQIQFTTNLANPQWSLPTGNVWIVGGQGYFNVPATQPSVFYRVVLIP
jgi:Tol biopolymer transport system component